MKKLKDAGHVETFSPEDSDYLLLFCPVVSCVGTDIKQALSSISGGTFLLIVINGRGKSTEEALRLLAFIIGFEGLIWDLTMLSLHLRLSNLGYWNLPCF